MVKAQFWYANFILDNSESPIHSSHSSDGLVKKTSISWCHVTVGTRSINWTHFLKPLTVIYINTLQRMDCTI